MYTAHGIKRNFGGVHALRGVDLCVAPGRVQALVGANGAGKSTLVKILAGADQPSEGHLELDGQPVRLNSVLDAASRGIAIVSQELNLFGDLDVLSNLFIGREKTRLATLSKPAMRRLAEPVLAEIGLDVPLDRRVGDLRLAEQQLVEIARALLEDPSILILDEPNSALQARESERLFDVIARMCKRGVGVVYVSHFLEEVFRVADEITVVRDGQIALERVAPEDTDISSIVREMVGESVANRRRIRKPIPPAPGSASLRLDRVCVPGSLSDIDLEVRPGEIVGLAGLDGSGVQTVLEAIYGIARTSSGTITLPDGTTGASTPARAARAGVALVPADRKTAGVFLDDPIWQNVAIVRTAALRLGGFVTRAGVLQERARQRIAELHVRARSPHAAVAELSGGNQQKVVFAKWLEARPSVFLLDDPTRGVDVGAKSEMYDVLTGLADGGAAVLMASSDLAELALVCDRIVTVHSGRVTGEVSGEQASEHVLLEAIQHSAPALSGTGAESG